MIADGLSDGKQSKILCTLAQLRAMRAENSTKLARFTGAVVTCCATLGRLAAATTGLDLLASSCWRETWCRGA